MDELKIHYFNRNLCLSKELAADLNGAMGSYISVEDFKTIMSAVNQLQKMDFKITGRVGSAELIVEKALGFV